MFTCCHPALARESQVALTLRLVCGVDVAAIAAVLLTGEAGVARRISRAKRKIAAAQIPFRVPDDDELPARLDTVLTVVHLVYTAGHVGASSGSRDAGPGHPGQRAAGPADTGLTGRAIGLARMLVALLPGEPEPQGLLGLMLLTEARGAARTGGDGELVLLPDQDRSGWDRRLIREGLALVTAALPAGPDGRFALQAGIAGLHAVAPSWAETDWAQVVTTYDALLRVWHSPVVALNRAVASARLPGADPAAVLAEVDELAPALDSYPYLPAARADLLSRLGRAREAAAAYDQALDRTTNPVERRFLARRRAIMGRPRHTVPREPGEFVASHVGVRPGPPGRSRASGAGPRPRCAAAARCPRRARATPPTRRTRPARRRGRQPSAGSPTGARRGHRASRSPRSPSRAATRSRAAPAGPQGGARAPSGDRTSREDHAPWRRGGLRTGRAGYAPTARQPCNGRFVV